jgi:separase
MKHPDVKSVDDMRWPRMSDTGEPLRTEPSSNHQKRQKIRRMRMDSDEEESDVEDDTINKEYWARVRARHDRHTFTEEDASVSSGEVDRLPDHWSIVHLCMTEDKNTIIASRQRANEEPLVFCLPLKDRRETEEDEQLGFQDAVAELADIIKSSDECTRSVKTMDKDNKDVRAAWWAERAALDTRMKELVENIEFCWLGGFKTILSRPSMATEEDIENLRQRFETIFHRCLHLRDKKVKNSVRLESGLVRCFSTLPPKSKDEELEDLVYFVLDLYQASGVHVVLSEVDVDQAVIELRSALEDHATKVVPKKGTKDDTHMFLVLDKNLQAIPWESTPILRGRSVSRIPNLSFLLDRVDLAQHQQKVAEDAKVDRLIVNPKETFYMLNPSGDLKGTETRFKPWVESMKAVGWSGIIGRVPSEQEFLDALQRKELVVYASHCNHPCVALVTNPIIT